MLDMLGNEVRKNYLVAYVYPNKGRTCTISGKIKEFNKKGCIISTIKGDMNVKNIIRLKRHGFLSKIFG